MNALRLFPLSILLLVLLLDLACSLHTEPHRRLRFATAVAVAPLDASIAAEPDPDWSKPLATGANWIKSSFSKLKTGSGGLWANFQECRAIRARVKGGAILDFGEHTMLQRGKEDRKKVVNIALMWMFLPEMIPFFLSFVPGAMPSTFENPRETAKRYSSFNRIRLLASLDTVAKIEKGCDHRKSKQRQEFERMRETCVRFLGAGSNRDAFECLKAHVYAPEPEKKGQKATSVEKLAKPLVTGTGKALGLSTPWTPTFVQRGQIREHLKKLAA
ncbi:unnamed protein product, partial [Chrysoparadoxa australica]